MKLNELGFRDYFDKYLVLECTWSIFTQDSEDFPWPEATDGTLVYAHDGHGGSVDFYVLCPVVLDRTEYLVDKTPEKVNAQGWGLGGCMNEVLDEVEIIIPNQDAAASLGLLPDHIFWCNDNRRRMLDATELDSLRTPYNLDCFEVQVDCGAYGYLPGRVRFEDYADGIYTGKLLDMFDDGVDVYENDTIAVKVRRSSYDSLPTLLGWKVVNPKQLDSPRLSDDERAALELWTNGLGSSAKRFAGEDPMPPKHEKATKDSWRSIRDMPSRNEEFWLGMEISAAEKNILEYGHIPEAMEDHWFMYYKDDVIRYFRSWSGYCIYEAFVEPCSDHYIVGRVKVNRYPGHYKETNIERDKYLLAMLIAWETGRA